MSQTDLVINEWIYLLLWLIGWLIYWLTNRLINWLINSETHRVTDWCCHEAELNDSEPDLCQTACSRWLNIWWRSIIWYHSRRGDAADSKLLTPVVWMIPIRKLALDMLKHRTFKQLTEHSQHKHFSKSEDMKGWVWGYVCSLKGNRKIKRVNCCLRSEVYVNT
jgi:hypothetical protein